MRRLRFATSPGRQPSCPSNSLCRGGRRRVQMITPKPGTGDAGQCVAEAPVLPIVPSSGAAHVFNLDLSGLTPWGLDHSTTRKRTTGDPGGESPSSQPGAPHVHQPSGRRQTSSRDVPRLAKRGVATRGSSSSRGLTRRAAQEVSEERIIVPAERNILTARNPSNLVFPHILDGENMPSSLGSDRLMSAMSPRWGQVLSRHGSMFESCVRTQQLATGSPRAGGKSAPGRISRKQTLRGSSETIETQIGDVKLTHPVPGAIYDKPYTAPTLPDSQPSQTEIAVQNFATTENLAEFEATPESFLILPGACSTRPDTEQRYEDRMPRQVPYSDLVSRHWSQENVTAQLGMFEDLYQLHFPDARAMKTMRYKKLQRQAAGKGCLTKGLARTDMNRGYARHCTALQRIGSFDAAGLDVEEGHLRRLDRSPSDLAAILGYAAFLTEKNRLVDAEGMYRRALALPFHGRSDEHADAVHAYATFLWLTDRSEKAEKFFQLGLSFNSQHFDMLRNYGLAMLSRGAYAGAKERFLRASLLRPSDIKVKLGYAVCLEHMRMTSYEDVNRVYCEILKLAPKNLDALMAYARFLKSHDKRLSAKECYEQALAVKPTDVSALCAYGTLLSEDASAEFLKKTGAAVGYPVACTALFAASEIAFLKALRLAPRDRAVMTGFAVGLSIKLRLLLFNAGATLKDLDLCRNTVRNQESELRKMHGIEAGNADPGTLQISELLSQGKLESPSRHPEDKLKRVVNGSFLIHTISGRPERLSRFRHENALNKSFTNAVDTPADVARTQVVSHAPYDDKFARLKLQAVARGHLARKVVFAIRVQSLRLPASSPTGLPFDVAHALANHLFEEALSLGPAESHILGAFAIFLFVVVSTPTAIARAKRLFAEALRLEKKSTTRDLAIYFIDLLSLYGSEEAQNFVRVLKKDFNLQAHATPRPLTPEVDFAARLSAVRGGLQDPKIPPKGFPDYLGDVAVSHSNISKRLSLCRSRDPLSRSFSGNMRSPDSKLTVQSLMIDKSIPPMLNNTSWERKSSKSSITTSPTLIGKERSDTAVVPVPECREN